VKPRTSKKKENATNAGTCTRTSTNHLKVHMCVPIGTSTGSTGTKKVQN
jgi:hypothetical protein